MDPLRLLSAGADDGDLSAVVRSGFSSSARVQFSSAASSSSSPLEAAPSFCSPKFAHFSPSSPSPDSAFFTPPNAAIPSPQASNSSSGSSSHIRHGFYAPAAAGFLQIADPLKPPPPPCRPTTASTSPPAGALMRSNWFYDLVQEGIKPTVPAAMASRALQGRKEEAEVGGRNSNYGGGSMAVAQMLLAEQGKEKGGFLLASAPAASTCSSTAAAGVSVASQKTISSGQAEPPMMQSLPMAKVRAPKRRKAQQKRVVCVPAVTTTATGGTSNRSGAGDPIPTDFWAWRKYGQKPIKGSPHPRGYYRCSSSKGCPARKQVERSISDPTMLVVTYTSDHNHPWPTHRINPNALGGSTKTQQPPLASTSSMTSPSSNEEPLRCPDRDANNPMDVDDDDDEDPVDASPHSDDVAVEAVSASSPGHISTSCGMTPAEPLLDAVSCVEDETYMPDAMFADMVEELGRQNRYNIGEVTAEEQGGSSASEVVDPFNLFNWSSTMTSAM